MGVPYAEVIGDPIAHSKSPAIHKYWLEILGIGGDYRATKVTAAELPAFLAVRRADPDWRGCNVTMPLKQAVIPWLDRSDDGRTGAVNCVLPRDGGLRGRNTDGAGIDQVIYNWDCCADGERICLIGAGGAARTAIAGLDVLCYFDFDLIVRDEAKGRAFLDSCDVNGDAYSFEHAGDAMVGRVAVINASPLGMTGFPAMPASVLDSLPHVGRAGLTGRDRRAFAFDMVAAPVRTEFVARAEAAGLGVSDGLTMLICQARIAFRSFFGVLPPESEQPIRALFES